MTDFNDVMDAFEARDRRHADYVAGLVEENVWLREEIAKCRSASRVVSEKPIEAIKEIARMKDNLKFCENWDCPFANDTDIAGLRFCFLNECARK